MRQPGEALKDDVREEASAAPGDVAAAGIGRPFRAICQSGGGALRAFPYPTERWLPIAAVPLWPCGTQGWNGTGPVSHKASRSSLVRLKART